MKNCRTDNICNLLSWRCLEGIRKYALYLSMRHKIFGTNHCRSPPLNFDIDSGAENIEILLASSARKRAAGPPGCRGARPGQNQLHTDSRCAAGAQHAALPAAPPAVLCADRSVWNFRRRSGAYCSAMHCCAASLALRRKVSTTNEANE